MIDEKEYVTIPGFSRYKINIQGHIYNTITNCFRKYTRDQYGYFRISLINDKGVQASSSRHRLLMLAFVEIPKLLDKPIVNHLNGIKGDDRLDNLEWTDNRGNILHAGSIGISPKCLPIASRCVYTGEVKFYPSVIDMATDSGMSKDAGAWRLKFGQDRIFPEMKQYRLALDKSDWPMPSVRDIEIASYGSSVKTLVKDVVTGIVTECNTARDAALMVGVCEAIVSIQTTQSKQTLIKGRYILKRKNDPSDWKVINDLEREQLMTGVNKGVTVVFEDGRVEKYDSIKSCAKTLGIGITTVHYRVMYTPGKRTRCGKKFYYTLDYNSKTGPFNQ